MLIGEITAKTGFSRDTIRYYEKIGLLRLPKKARRENNYKEYSTAVVSRLRAIRQLKQIGYTLGEIQRVIDAYEAGTLNCPAGKEQVLTKVRSIDEQIRQLLTVRTQLLAAVADCPNHCKLMDVLTNTLRS